MKITPSWPALAALAAGVLAAPVAAAEGRHSASVGFDYSSGKYGSDTSTDIWSLPIGYGYRSERWALKLVVPWLRVSGAGNVIPGVGGTLNTNPRGRGRNGLPLPVPGTGDPAETTGTASGLGDVVASAAYTLVADPASGFGLDLSGKLKLATADADQGLGSGENDVTVGVDAYRTRGDLTVFGGLSYAMLGDSEFLQLEDVAGANVGASVKLGEAASWGAVYDYRQRASAQSDTRRELMAFYSHQVGGTARLQAYVLKGFSDGSPDLGGGLSLNYGF